MTRFGDVRYWIESRTHSPDEIALRFHHRLVFIHPFSNGNGRHARLIADVLITKVGRSSFTWVLPISSKKAEHARDIWKRSERRMMATSSRFSSSPARSRSALLSYRSVHLRTARDEKQRARRKQPQRLGVNYISLQNFWRCGSSCLRLLVQNLHRMK